MSAPTPPVPALGPDGERGRFYRRGVLLAGGFLVVVVVGAVAVSLRDGGGQQPAASRAGAPGAASPLAGCRPRDTNQAILTEPPRDVTWTLFQSIAVPSSPTAGPLMVQGEVARCYAHTPTGALLAMVQIGTRYTFADDWRSVTLQQVIPGPGRDRFIRLRRTATGEAAPGTYGQFAGFKFVDYSPERAVVQIVTRFANDASLQVGIGTVVWSEGDWKLQLQPDGSETPNAQPVSSLAGFVPWRGV